MYELLERLRTEKKIFLFQFSKIGKTTIKGVDTFLSTSNGNFAKLGVNVKFDILFDPIFSNKNDIIGQKVYLCLKDEENYFSNFDDKILQHMIMEFLFHVIGLLVEEMEKIKNE